MNITLKTKWLNTLLILTLMLGTLGITTAAAKCDPAKNDHCPVNAPGQQTNDDADDVVVINNGGQTLPDNAVANGVVKKEDDTVTVVNNGGQTLPDNAVANGVVNQMESAEDATTAPASPGVISASQGNQPAGADCSSLAGVVLTPPAETVTAQELHDLLQWDWKDGPTGGRNRIRATNVCVSNGGNGQWHNNLPEPANSVNDIASWKKLQRWADLYNAGQLVVFTP